MGNQPSVEDRKSTPHSSTSRSSTSMNHSTSVPDAISPPSRTNNSTSASSIGSKKTKNKDSNKPGPQELNPKKKSKYKKKGSFSNASYSQKLDYLKEIRKFNKQKRRKRYKLNSIYITKRRQRYRIQNSKEYIEYKLKDTTPNDTIPNETNPILIFDNESEQHKSIPIENNNEKEAIEMIKVENNAEIRTNSNGIDILNNNNDKETHRCAVIADDFAKRALIGNQLETIKSSGDSMDIFVKTLTGKTIILNVAANETVLSVKLKIQDTEGSSPEEQRLLYRGIQLINGATLSDFNIQQHDTIRLLTRLPGGMNDLPNPNDEQQSNQNDNEFYNCEDGKQVFSMFRSNTLIKSFDSNTQLVRSLQALGTGFWSSPAELTLMETVKSLVERNDECLKRNYLRKFSIQMICCEIIELLTHKYILSMTSIKDIIRCYSLTPSAETSSNRNIRRTYLSKIPCLTFNLPYIENNSLLTQPSYETFIILSSSPPWIPDYMIHVVDILVYKILKTSIYRINNINNLHNISKYYLNYNHDLNNNVGVFSIKSILQQVDVSGTAFDTELMVRKNSHQLINKHVEAQGKLFEINNNKEKYTQIVGEKMHHEFIGYYNALCILENKNESHANDNNKLMNEIQRQNYMFLIKKLIFGIWKKTKVARRERMYKYREKNQLFLCTNKQNSGGSGAKLFGVAEASRFANCMLECEFDGTIAVCSRRQDLSMKFSKDKQSENILYLGFITYAAICEREQVQLGLLKHKDALDILKQYKKDGVVLDFNTTIKNRWKSKSALSWYNDPGKSKTRHSLKIKRGPSLFLWKARKKSQSMSAGNHLNCIFNHQLQIHFQKDSLIVSFDDDNIEKDIRHAGGDASSVKRFLTPEGYNCARNNKSIVSNQTFLKGGFCLAKTSEFGDPAGYIQSYVIVDYKGILWCKKTLKYNRAYKQRIQIAYTFPVCIAKANAAYITSVWELSMTTPINDKLDDTLWISKDSEWNQIGIHPFYQKELLMHYIRVRKTNKMLECADISRGCYDKVYTDYMLNILQDSLHDHRLIHGRLEDIMDCISDQAVQEFLPITLDIAAQVDRLINLIDMYKTNNVFYGTMNKYHKELLEHNIGVEDTYYEFLDILSNIRYKGNQRWSSDGGAGGSIKQKSVLVNAAEFVICSHIQTFITTHCAAKRSFTQIAEQPISGLKLHSSFNAPSGNSKKASFIDINNKTDLRCCDLSEMKDETAKKSIIESSKEKVRRFNSMVDGQECMGSYICAETHPPEDTSDHLTDFVPQWQYEATQKAKDKVNHPHRKYFSYLYYFIQSHSLIVPTVCLAIDAKLCTYGAGKRDLKPCMETEHAIGIYGHGINIGIPNTPKPIGWHTKQTDGTYVPCEEEQIIRNDKVKNKYFLYSKPTGKPIGTDDIDSWGMDMPYKIFFDHMQQNIQEYYDGSINEFNKYNLTSTTVGVWPNLHFSDWVKHHLMHFHKTYGPWMEDYERMLCHIMRYSTTMTAIQSNQRKPCYDIFTKHLNEIIANRYDIINKIESETLNVIFRECSQADTVNLDQFYYMIQCYVKQLTSVIKKREIKLLKQTALQDATLWICPVCQQLVALRNNRNPCCSLCFIWVHIECAELTTDEKRQLTLKKGLFLCNKHSDDGTFTAVDKKQFKY
eukprot:347976_1